MTDENAAAPIADGPADAAADGSIRIFLTSSVDTGFADFIRLPEGSTIAQFWANQYGAQDVSKYVIRITREDGESPTGRLPADFVLVEGDRVTVTPHKVAGA